MVTFSNQIREAELLVLTQPTNVDQCQKLSSLYREIESWQQLSHIYKLNNKNKKLLANAFYNAGYVKKSQGEYEQAIQNYNFSLDFDVEKPEEVYVNLSVIYSENLRIEEKAIAMLKQALKVNENFIPALYNLAGLYEEKGIKKQAIELYQRILILSPLDIDVLIRLSTCLNGKESCQIISQLKEVLNSSNLTTEDEINLLYALGKTYDDNQDYSLAFKAYERANILESKLHKPYSLAFQENFVDENIRVFDHQWFANLPIISKARPIFICGMFRSGSTLLEQVLSAHTEITAGGEVDFFDSYVQGLGTAYPTDIRLYSETSLIKVADSYLGKLKKLFPKARLLTDKRPDNFLYIGLIKTLFPNAIIIHTQRNINDNCLAIYFQRLHNKLTYATNLVTIKHYYQQHQCLMEHWKSLFPDSFHLINYEELVSSPEQCTKSLFSSLGLKWQKQCHQFYLNENSVKTASIWQVRKPLHKGSCERWKNYKEELSSVLK